MMMIKPWLASREEKRKGITWKNWRKYMHKCDNL